MLEKVYWYSATRIQRHRSIALLVLCGGLLFFQACVMAPTSDEAGHLVSGIATARTGDPGFYRVNPPLHRLVSGTIVDLALAPKIPGLYPASFMASGSRHEFELANDFLRENASHYRGYFVLGRLARIPFILIATWLLIRSSLTLNRRASIIAAVLWATSPMVLGHGWVIMPDALSGCAAIFLIDTSLAWLAARSWLNFVLTGVAWGIAISTKFTFCPLFVLWPIALIAHQWIARNRGLHAMLKIIFTHLATGFLALAIVIVVYGVNDIGVPMEQHGFQSHRMRSLSQHIKSMPSPFPKQFLIGIDEQQIDLEQGYPTYWMGNWYPDGSWWYYLVGLIAKEQIAFLVGLIVSIIGGILLFNNRGKDAEDRSRLASFVFCILIVGLVLGTLSMHSRMALNVRYVFPALPAAYIAIGLGVSSVFQEGSKYWLRFRAAMGLVIAIELAMSCPYYFAYLNPIFGGMYNVPPVLHDSNFDGGQDLWFLEDWVAEHPTPEGCKRYLCIHGNLPVAAMKVTPSVPETNVIKEMIAAQQHAGHLAAPINMANVEIVIMRGLGTPAPWTQLAGHHEPSAMKAIAELLEETPDEFITPTVVVYRSNNR